MGWKIFFSFIFVVIVILLLFVYWFIPLDTTEFKISNSDNSNFSLSSYEGEEMQFYPNMRFKDTRISYRIENCPLKKEDEMLKAFNVISSQTSLNFYSVNAKEEIFITCESKDKIEGGMFIAGEGGPTNVTKTDIFNVISNGKILLIRESECSEPNIAIHELLHVLGFAHSDNEKNIMYPFTKCWQTIGEDIINLINKIYLTPSNPDLSFENISAMMNGKYLSVNMTIRNNGLKDAQESKVIISADETTIKEIELEPIEIGYGRMIKLSDLWIRKMNIDELEFLIDSNFEELDKKNNKIILKIKE